MKYRNRPTGGYASKKEAKRARELRLLEKAGEITNLKEQLRFELLPSQDGERPVHYVADFVYNDGTGKIVVEDTKGFRTREYIIKRKLMLWRHGLKISEL